MTQNYIDFIRYALNVDEELPLCYNEISWRDFFQFCHRQSILGIVYAGLERANIRIPQDVLLEWIGTVEIIKTQNKLANRNILFVTNWLKNKGIRSVILKGQANGLMYPHPELRSTGDIDVWVEGSDIDIIKMVRTVCPDAHYSLHHIKMLLLNDISLEVHYSPIHLRFWCKDWRLQKYIDSERKNQFANKVYIDDGQIGGLTDEFNLIYQMLHMYGHYFTSRNNLKQILDYYYLLKKADCNSTRANVVEKFKEFGVYSYAKGMMWLMKELFGLPDESLLVKPDSEFGKVLFIDTMSYGIDNTHNKMLLMVSRIKDNYHLMTFFPLEVMVSPIYIMWHQCWRLKMWLKLSIGN